MNKILRCLLLPVLLLAAALSSYAFTVDGITYNILDTEAKTVEVVRGDTPYTGEVVIPATVHYGPYDFSVVALGNNAFTGGASATKVTVGDNVKVIGKECFYHQTSLTEIILGNSVEEIGANAFSYCYNLATINWPESLLKIGSYAFDDTKITNGNLNEGLQKIEESAFVGTKIEEVSIPSSLRSLGSCAFSKCSNLKKCYIEEEDSTLWVGSSVFTYWGLSPIDTLSINRPVTGGTYGDEQMFSGISSLKFVEINKNSDIQEEMFKGCTALDSIVFGPETQVIGKDAFGGCKQIMAISCKAVVPPTSPTKFPLDIYYVAKLYIPERTIEAYKEAGLWKDFYYDGNVFEVFPNPCTALEEIEGNPLSAEVKAVYSIDGRRLSEIVPGRVNIVVYSDGRVEKVIR